ncbi:MAG: hypothetical protein KGI60_04890, partial [Patescibacteria group bacterium]|nr:hypothetical protein [Patescibacteria group bacterium]
RKWLARNRNELATSTGEVRDMNERCVKKSEGNCAKIRESIAHLLDDKPRLVKFYRDTGRFRLGWKSFVSNKLAHHPVVS